jgi:probable phosphoglycerate mutase
MTAERIAAATGAPIGLDPGLQERNFGDVRGQPYAALGVDLFAPDYVPPGGESWAAFHARVDAAWPRVVAAACATDGNLAVVTHGLVCRAVAERQLGLTPERWTPPWRNASLTVIDGGPPWTVPVANCTTHLREEE